MKGSLLHRFVGFCLVLLLSIGAVSSARAQTAVRTVLVVAGVEPRRIGEDISILAELQTETGSPIPDQVISLIVDGSLIEEGITDLSGQVNFHFEPDLPAGTYLLLIDYLGAPGYEPTQFVSELEFTPVELSVQIIPPLSGLAFSLDDRMFVSEEDGIARIMVDIPDVYRIEFQKQNRNDQPYHADFKRWEPDFFDKSRVIYIPESSELVAGFELSFPVDMIFVDNQGKVIDPQRISSITLRSSQSAILTFTNDDLIWLQKNRIVRRLRGLDDVDVTYTVQNVMIDGSNVVNQGQQRFEVTPGIPWEINVLLYSLNLSAKEAVFGFPIGNSVELTYPDGHNQKIRFDENHRIHLENLARGTYNVRARSYLGLSITIPVVLSRNQQMELLVYSFPTLFMILLLPLSIALMLPIFGRTRVRVFIKELFHTLITDLKVRGSPIRGNHER